eukprot:CAMPEP_0172803898 /NCGR_PEP_ID=MMETSP1075-20121228/4806_1 /TAXON_ID=2916 /ORGANISM="Ceratium fusus, Strain PA161109" /LENGTH=252 /DNA_ID=CAMNT_0013642397 /DNA_START=66 /DNA_END=822 /DNA_ORIENTATION=+
MAAFGVPARQVMRHAAVLASRPLGSTCRVAAQQTPLARLPLRGFSSAGGKVAKAISAEIKHEEEQYEQAKEIKAFLKNSSFKLVEKDGDVNMALEREIGDKTVRIEWQLTSPFDPEAMGEQEGVEQEATEVAISIENKNGAGMTFYCSTQTGEDHRYVIGMVKSYTSAEEKDSLSSYNGPEFEDLDDKLQEAFDEYLAELGMNSEVCDFIDAMAVDKEQREYVRWLKTTQKFLEEEGVATVAASAVAEAAYE